MIKKPFYSSKVIIILVPLLLLFVNGVCIYFLGVKVIEENRVDKVFHILGGVSVSFSAAGVLWHLVHRKIIALQDEYVLRMLVYGFVCLAVINWEIIEYIVVEHEHLTYSDTITDMICGLIGGLGAIFFIRRPVG